MAKTMTKKATATVTNGKRKLTFLGTVKTSANAVHLFLNGEEMNLRQDEDTWSGKETRSVEDSVQVNFTVNGFEGTDWSVTLAIKCAEDSPAILTKSGTVGDPGGHGFAKNAKIPAEPCGNNG